MALTTFNRPSNAIKNDGTLVASGIPRFESYAPIFTRPSGARKNDGTLVASGIPRFENTAVDIEGTTNLFPDNYSQMTVDVASWVNYGAAKSRETGAEFRRFGIAAIKLITEGLSDYEGIYPMVPVSTSSGGPRTFAVDLCGAGIVRIDIEEYKTGPGTVGVTESAIITLTSTPTRYAVTRNFASDSDKIYCHVKVYGRQVATICASAFQMEDKDHATAWIPGGTTRAPTYHTGLTIEDGTANLVQADWSVYDACGGSCVVTDGVGQWAGWKHVVASGTSLAWGGFAYANPGVPCALGAAQAYAIEFINDGVSPVELDVTGAFGVGGMTQVPGTNRYLCTFTNDEAHGHGYVGDEYVYFTTTPNSAVNASFYVRCWQVEPSLVGTSYIDPGSWRAGEILKIQAKDVVAPTQGTIEMIVNVGPTMVDAIYPRFIYATNNDAPNRLNLCHYPNGTYQMSSSDGDGHACGDSCSDTGVTSGLHRFGVTWNSASMCLYIDGVLKIHVDNPVLPSFLSTMYFGQLNGYYYINTQISDIVISRIARSAADMAARGVITQLGIDNNTVYYLPLTSDLHTGTIAGGVTIEEPSHNYYNNGWPYSGNTVNPDLRAIVSNQTFETIGLTAPVPSEMTWGLTYTGVDVQWAGWESPFQLPALNVGDKVTISGYYKIPADYPIYAGQLILAKNDWSGIVSTQTYVPYIKDNQWHHFSITSTVTEACTNPVVCDIAGVSYINWSGTTYWNGLKIEIKPYATTSIPQTETRYGETITVPITGVLSPTSGSIEFVINVNDELRASYNVTNRVMFDCYNGDSFITCLVSGGGYVIWYISGTGWSGFSSTSNVLPATNGPSRVSLSYDSSGLACYINGHALETVPTPNLPIALPNVAIIGGGGGTSHINTQISDLIFSDVARSASELGARGIVAPLGWDDHTTFCAPMTNSTASTMKMKITTTISLSPKAKKQITKHIAVAVHLLPRIRKNITKHISVTIGLFPTIGTLLVKYKHVYLDGAATRVLNFSGNVARLIQFKDEKD